MKKSSHRGGYPKMGGFIACRWMMGGITRGSEIYNGAVGANLVFAQSEGRHKVCPYVYILSFVK